MKELWDLYDKVGNKIPRQIYRGEALNPGEFHLVVSALIQNREGKYLISRRAEPKKGANSLETVGGAATSGETSLEAVLREIYEEVGLVVEPSEIKFLKRYTFETQRSYHYDIWSVVKDFEFDTLIPQVEEVSEVMLLEPAKVIELIETGQFFNYEKYKTLVDEGLIHR